MRVLSTAALCGCVLAAVTPTQCLGVSVPVWGTGIPAQVVVPAGGTTSVAAPGSLFKESLDIALVMDNSLSMGFLTGQIAPSGGQQRGDWARDGANAFLAGLPDESRLVLTKFARTSNVVIGIDALGPDSPPSPHRSALKAAIDGLSRNESSTNIESGIRVAADALNSAGGVANKHIVLVTDGQSTSGRPISAVDAAIAGGIAGVHAVGLPGADAGELTAIAQRGNGQFVDGASLTSLISRFTTILDNVDPISRLDILDSTGGVLLGNLPLQSTSSFVATLDVREGLNRFIARATSASGAQRSAELVIEGIAVPEPAPVGMLAIGVAMLAGATCPRALGSNRRAS